MRHYRPKESYRQYIPRTRQDLIYLLTAYWPNEKAWLHKLNKKQLYALFFKEVYGRAVTTTPTPQFVPLDEVVK